MPASIGTYTVHMILILLYFIGVPSHIIWPKSSVRTRLRVSVNFFWVPSGEDAVGRRDSSVDADRRGVLGMLTFSGLSQWSNSGDSVETAVNIASICRLVDKKCTMYYLVFQDGFKVKLLVGPRENSFGFFKWKRLIAVLHTGVSWVEDRGAEQAQDSLLTSPCWLWSLWTFGPAIFTILTVDFHIYRDPSRSFSCAHYCWESSPSWEAFRQLCWSTWRLGWPGFWLKTSFKMWRRVQTSRSHSAPYPFLRSHFDENVRVLRTHVWPCTGVWPDKVFLQRLVSHFQIVLYTKNWMLEIGLEHFVAWLLRPGHKWDCAVCNPWWAQILQEVLLKMAAL